MIKSRRTQRYWLTREGPANSRIVDTHRVVDGQFADVCGIIASLEEALRRLDHLNYDWQENGRAA